MTTHGWAPEAEHATLVYKELDHAVRVQNVTLGLFVLTHCLSPGLDTSPRAVLAYAELVHRSLTPETDPPVTLLVDKADALGIDQAMLEQLHEAHVRLSVATSSATLAAIDAES